jgi:hypothetical protein
VVQPQRVKRCGYDGDGEDQGCFQALFRRGGW